MSRKDRRKREKEAKRRKKLAQQKHQEKFGSGYPSAAEEDLDSTPTWWTEDQRRRVEGVDPDGNIDRVERYHAHQAFDPDQFHDEYSDERMLRLVTMEELEKYDDDELEAIVEVRRKRFLIDAEDEEISHHFALCALCALCALAAEDPGDRYVYIGLALMFDPRNVDALVLRALLVCTFEEDALLHIENTIDGARAGLGKDFFEVCEGQFWIQVRTRPFLRAMSGYADMLTELDRIEDAIEVYEEMLRLAPHDVMGMRHSLVALYLAEAGTAEARALFDRFPDDAAGSRLWALTLADFIDHGPDGAAESLAKARAACPFAEPYLSGFEELPLRPAGYFPGTPEEGVSIANNLMVAWVSHPTAQLWLMEPRD